MRLVSLEGICVGPSSGRSAVVATKNYQPPRPARHGDRGYQNQSATVTPRARRSWLPRTTSPPAPKSTVIVATKTELPTSTQERGDGGYQKRTAHEHRK